jgi:hypothetical protein
VLSHLLRAWKLGFTTSHMSQVLSSKYDMYVYMTTLFGGSAQLGSGLVFRVGPSEKLNPILYTSLETIIIIIIIIIIIHEIIRPNFYEYKPCFQESLRLKCRDSRSILGLVNMTET